MGIVDDLLANPGTYLGVDREIDRGDDSAAKIVIASLAEPASRWTTKCSMPEHGKLIHSWSYGAPGEEPIQRDRAELTRSA